MKKFSKVICYKGEHGSWKVKTDPLKEGSVEEVQKKVMEVIDIMTQIKMNNNSLMNWWFLKKEVKDYTTLIITTCIR